MNDLTVFPFDYLAKSSFVSDMKVALN